MSALKVIRSLSLTIAGSTAIACLFVIAHREGQLEIVSLFAWGMWCSLREVRS